MSKAERESYGYIDQTCPIVDALAATCMELIQKDLEEGLSSLSKNIIDDARDKIQYRVETLVGKIKDQATKPLRNALIDVICEKLTVEDDRDEALNLAKKFSDEKDSIESDCEYWKNLYEQENNQEKLVKFNTNVTIPEYREECTHGVIGYNDVKLECRRAIGEVVISQDVDVIRLSEDQAIELYKHLHSTFGE